MTLSISNTSIMYMPYCLYLRVNTRIVYSFIGTVYRVYVHHTQKQYAYTTPVIRVERKRVLCYITYNSGINICARTVGLNITHYPHVTYTLYYYVELLFQNECLLRHALNRFTGKVSPLCNERDYNNI